MALEELKSDIHEEIRNIEKLIEDFRQSEIKEASKYVENLKKNATFAGFLMENLEHFASCQYVRDASIKLFHRRVALLEFLQKLECLEV